MGLIFKARGNASIAPFFIRFSIGLLFLVAGAIKVVDIQGFIYSVQALNVMPENVAFILGFILPFAEIILGGLYMIGIFTPVVSLLMSFMIVGILATNGAGDPVLPFSYNFVFLACTISTIFSGAGILSFDALIDRKKKPARDVNITPAVVEQKVEPVTEEIEVELIEPNDSINISDDRKND